MIEKTIAPSPTSTSQLTELAVPADVTITAAGLCRHVAPIVVGSGLHAGTSSGCGNVDGSGYDGRVGASVRLITRRSQVHLLRPRRPITT